MTGASRGDYCQGNQFPTDLGLRQDDASSSCIRKTPTAGYSLHAAAFTSDYSVLLNQVYHLTKTPGRTAPQGPQPGTPTIDAQRQQWYVPRRQLVPLLLRK